MISKNIILISLFMSLLFIGTSKICDSVTPIEKKDCLYADIPTGYYRCCYIEYKTESTYKECTSVTKNEFDNIKDLIKGLEKISKASGIKMDVKKLNCRSSYISLSFLSLLAFLI